jgi:hypothetical protein
MNTLFNKKAQSYYSKPINIKAAKYEKGMENGWIVEFFEDSNDFGYDFKIFDTEAEALKYYNQKPLQEVAIVRNGKSDIIHYQVEYNKPKPCLWHIETKSIDDFGYKWEEQVYEILEDNSWLIQFEGSNEFSVYDNDFIKSDWILNE